MEKSSSDVIDLGAVFIPIYSKKVKVVQMILIRLYIVRKLMWRIDTHFSLSQNYFALMTIIWLSPVVFTENIGSIHFMISLYQKSEWLVTIHLNKKLIQNKKICVSVVSTPLISIITLICFPIAQFDLQITFWK